LNKASFLNDFIVFARKRSLPLRIGFSALSSVFGFVLIHELLNKISYQNRINLLFIADRVLI